MCDSQSFAHTLSFYSLSPSSLEFAHTPPLRTLFSSHLRLLFPPSISLTFSRYSPFYSPAEVFASSPVPVVPEHLFAAFSAVTLERSKSVVSE